MKIKLVIILLVFLSVKSVAQFGPQQIITTDALLAEHVVASDIDGDGDLDVVSASSGNDTIGWYENIDGLGTFGSIIIISSSLEMTDYVFAADLDGDGDMDILATSPLFDLVVWYENLDGMGTFSTANLISDLVMEPKSAIAADLDGDGDMDVISVSLFDNKAAWYENTDGLGNFGPQQIISEIDGSNSSVFAADLDGDNDLDVIVTADDRLYWYENLDGLGAFSPGILIVFTVDGFHVSVISIDIDGDNDNDVVSAEIGASRVAWYENTDGQGNFGPQQIISDEIGAPYLLFSIDLDNDNDNDVLSLSGSNDSIVWFENTDGLGNFGSQQIITTNVNFPKSVFAADLDNDGDNDVLSASEYDYKIAWYENLTILGLEDDTLVNLTLYPNPAETTLYINNPNSISIRALKVYNIFGQLVLEKNYNFTQIDISSLASGLFFIKMETTDGDLYRKFIKD